jgi:RimJ/RimL family protein N-acetyltransferase
MDLTDPRFTSELPLADGGRVRLRPIVPEDDPAYRAFAAGLSPESVYFRFFSPRSTLTEREIEHFLHVDYVNRFAIVAVVGDEIVGVGRYDRARVQADPTQATPAGHAVEPAEDGPDAEIAFVVTDAYQGNGIATEMLRLLGRAARDNGIQRFVAFVLPDNHKMLHLFAESGWVVDRHLEDGVIAVALAITEPPDG